MMINIDESLLDQNETDLSDSRKGVDFTDASKKLSAGLLNIYQTPLEEIKNDLNDLTKKQESLLSQLQIENQNLQKTLEDENLNEMFKMIKMYQGQLVSVKRDMVTIHERASKLKKRALKLQQMKQKEALNKVQQREQEIQRETDLIGKPSTS